MIKDKLQGPIQPAEMGMMGDSGLHYEIFRLLTQPELLKEEGLVDRNHPDVLQFFKILAPLMIGYVRPGADWDLVDVIANPAEHSDETIVISDGQGTVRAVGNLELKLNNEVQSVHVSGILVDPELRGAGVASWILGRAAELYNPDVFQGTTNSEIAALSRAQILRKFGYTSFIGGQRIASPEHAALSQEELMTKRYAWLRSREQTNPEDGSIFHPYEHPEDGRILFRRAPFPKFKQADRTDRRPISMSAEEWGNLKRVFDLIIAEQIENPEMLIQAPLSSIR